MDGIVFATPIWWGVQSSYIQSMFERLDPIYSWAKDNKYQPFYNKVFGTLVSGGGDGFQHIHANCYNFAANLGFTIPPNCNIESKAQGSDEIKNDEDTLNQVKNCAINMSVWAELLKEANPTLDARHGTVDVSAVGGETDYAFGENFADGKKPGRKGLSQRVGIPKNATMAQLQKAAKAKGEKGRLARWQLNMRRGRKKKK